MGSNSVVRGLTEQLRTLKWVKDSTLNAT